MSELKFRAWLENVERAREVDGEIVWNTESYYDYDPIINNNGLLDVEYGCDILGNSDEKYTIEQYTGLKDKNGKEIYEGDILGDMWRGGYIAWCDKCKQLQYHILTHGCMACLGDVQWYELANDKGKLEVIGNIHENADLLEGK